MLVGPAQLQRRPIPLQALGSHPGAPAATPQETPAPPRLCPSPRWMRGPSKHINYFFAHTVASGHSSSVPRQRPLRPRFGNTSRPLSFSVFPTSTNSFSERAKAFSAPNPKEILLAFHREEGFPQSQQQLPRKPSSQVRESAALDTVFPRSQGPSFTRFPTAHSS